MRIEENRRISGRRLVEELDKGKAKPKVAFWMLQEEQARWRLVISSNESVPRKTYREIQKVLRKKKDITISLDEISVVKTNEPILNLMRKMIVTGDSISDIDMSGNVVNGHPLPDSHVYRLTT